MNKCIHILEIDLVEKKRKILEYINEHFNLIYNCSLCQLDRQVLYCLENNCIYKLCDESKHYLEHYEEYKHYIYFSWFSSEFCCIKCDQLIEIDYNYEILDEKQKILNQELISFKRNVVKEIRINFLRLKEIQYSDYFGIFDYYDNNNYVECSFYFIYGIKYLRECFLKIYYNEVQLYNKVKSYANSKVILIISKIIYQIGNKSKIDESLLDEFKKIMQNFFPGLKNSSNLSINSYINILLGLIHKKMQTIQINEENFKEENKNQPWSDLYFKNILIDDSIIIKCFDSLFETEEYCNNCDYLNTFTKCFISAKIQVLEKSKYKDIDKLKNKLRIKSKKRSFFDS